MNRTAVRRTEKPYVDLSARGIIMDNSKKAERRKQEDIALNHALLWFAAAVVLEFLVLLVNNYYIGFSSAPSSIAIAKACSVAIKIVCPVALLAAVFGGFWCWKRWKAVGTIPFLAVLLTVSVLVAGVGAGLIILYYDAAVQLLCLLVPAGAVLAFLFYLYQKDFFLSACAIGVGLLGLWLVRKNGGNHDLIVNLYMVLGALVLLGAAILVSRLSKEKGVLSVKGTQYRVLAARANYMLMLVSCVISLAAMLGGLLLGSAVAFYLLFVLLAWLFVLLVYYTVKLM